MAKRDKGDSKKKRSDGPELHEWIGARVQTPLWIEDAQGEPRRSDVIIWQELPSQLIVATEVIDPVASDVTFAEVLRRTLAAPAAGPPREPRRVRVADARLASEVRDVLPDAEVVVAPTPELDELLQQMMQAMLSEHDDTLSYFERGRIGEPSVHRMFAAAEALFRQAPWDQLEAGDLMRLDIPRLDIEGACVSVIGQLGESFGVLIFPSLLAYERFDDASRAGFGRGPIDMGTTLLSLSYYGATELPASMRREALQHDWPVASPDAYPSVQQRDRDGTPRPVSERDVAVATRCAEALAALVARDDEDDGDVVVVTDDEGVETRLTLFYDDELSPASPPDETSASAVHQMDQMLVEEMMRFAHGRFGDEFLRCTEVFFDPDEALQLFLPWAVYQFDAHAGKPLVHWFVRARGAKLSSREKRWLAAQQAAWLSVWEVADVVPGQHIDLEDLLTGERRTVYEVKGSRVLQPHLALLGRIVDFDGVSLIAGSHPRPLPPFAAAEVVRRARGRLRRKTAVPPERLRGDKMSRYLIKRWEEAVEELAEQPQIPQRLQNTDGDELLMTTDHFAFDPADRDAVTRALLGLDGARRPTEEDASEWQCMIARDDDDDEAVVLGLLRIVDDKLRVETNSLARADALRQRVLDACAGLIRHRAREHADPMALLSERDV